MYVRMCRSTSCRFWYVGCPRHVLNPSILENNELTSPVVKFDVAAFARNWVVLVAAPSFCPQAGPVSAAMAGKGSWFSKKGWAAGVCPAARAAATASYACANDCFDAWSTKKYGAELKFTPCGNLSDHRPVQPISTIMFPGISRWIVKSPARLRPILVFGSSWKLNSSPNGALGTTGMFTEGTVGTGRFPSTPTRNDAAPGLPAPAAALQLGPGAPEALHNGAPTLIVCANPTPNIGMITLCTVFMRS